MREIKFRIWSDGIDKGIWYPSSVLISGNHVYKAYTETHKLKDDTNPHMVLMQYIGRKDKDGKPIYEGDIVKVVGHRDAMHGQVEIVHIGKVYYSEQALAFTTNNYRIDLSKMACEIIGNIYENPDLLPKPNE